MTATLAIERIASVLIPAIAAITGFVRDNTGTRTLTTILGTIGHEAVASSMFLVINQVLKDTDKKQMYYEAINGSIFKQFRNGFLPIFLSLSVIAISAAVNYIAPQFLLSTPISVSIPMFAVWLFLSFLAFPSEGLGSATSGKCTLLAKSKSWTTIYIVILLSIAFSVSVLPYVDDTLKKYGVLTLTGTVDDPFSTTTIPKPYLQFKQMGDPLFWRTESGKSQLQDTACLLLPTYNYQFFSVNGSAGPCSVHWSSNNMYFVGGNGYCTLASNCNDTLPMPTTGVPNTCVIGCMANVASFSGSFSSNQILAKTTVKTSCKESDEDVSLATSCEAFPATCQLSPCGTLADYIDAGIGNGVQQGTIMYLDSIPSAVARVIIPIIVSALTPVLLDGSGHARRFVYLGYGFSRCDGNNSTIDSVMGLLARVLFILVFTFESNRDGLILLYYSNGQVLWIIRSILLVIGFVGLSIWDSPAEWRTVWGRK